MPNDHDYDPHLDGDALLQHLHDAHGMDPNTIEPGDEWGVHEADHDAPSLNGTTSRITVTEDVTGDWATIDVDGVTVRKGHASDILELSEFLATLSNAGVDFAKTSLDDITLLRE